MSFISTPTPGINALLRHARLVALECHAGEDATPENLDRLAASLRIAVVAQVLAGLWKELGVTELGHITGLRVACKLDNALLSEAPIKVDWDFSRTKLNLLVVESDAPEQSS